MRPVRLRTCTHRATFPSAFTVWFRVMESAQSLDLLAQGLTGLGHPIRIRALALLEFEYSPSQLAPILQEPLGVVSYHVRMLRDYVLVEITRQEPKRGALQHFYQRTELADQLLSRLNGLLDLPPRTAGRPGQKRRDALAAWALAA
jgi:DNA-binding transcriptional ArsR family regulator